MVHEPALSPSSMQGVYVAGRPQDSLAAQLGLHAKPPMIAFDWQCDPRSTLFMIVIFNIVMLGSGSVMIASGMGLLVAILTSTTMSTKTWWITWVSFVTAIVAYGLVPMYFKSGCIVFMVFLLFWIPKFIIIISVSMYALFTISPSDLSATMDQMRCPRTIRIPMVVMLRFIPSAFSELNAISDAMVLRGIRPGIKGFLRHPLRTAEYVLVPFLSSTSRIAEDLAAAAMIRGLDAPIRPTSLKVFRFRVQDGVLILAAIGALVAKYYVH